MADPFLAFEPEDLELVPLAFEAALAFEADFPLLPLVARPLPLFADLAVGSVRDLAADARLVFAGELLAEAFFVLEPELLALLEPLPEGLRELDVEAFDEFFLLLEPELFEPDDAFDVDDELFFVREPELFDDLRPPDEVPPLPVDPVSTCSTAAPAAPTTAPAAAPDKRSAITSFVLS